MAKDTGYIVHLELTIKNLEEKIQALTAKLEQSTRTCDGCDAIIGEGGYPFTYYIDGTPHEARYCRECWHHEYHAEMENARVTLGIARKEGA